MGMESFGMKSNKQIDKIATTNINQTPVQEEKMVRMGEILMNELAALPTEKIVAEKARVPEDQKPLLDMVYNAKTANGSVRLIDRVAQGRIYDFSDLEKVVVDQDVRRIVHVITEAAMATAQVKFPKELAAQEKERDADMANENERRRKELGKINVS